MTNMNQKIFSAFLTACMLIPAAPVMAEEPDPNSAAQQSEPDSQEAAGQESETQTGQSQTEENEETETGQQETAEPKTNEDQPDEQTPESPDLTPAQPIASISQDTSGQTIEIVQGQSLQITETGSKAVTLDACTFVITGTPESGKTAKVIVSGDVIFKNCTFRIENCMAGDMDSSSIFEISGGKTDMKQVSIDSLGSEIPLFTIEEGAGLETENSRINSSQSQSTVIDLKGGQAAFTNSTADIAGAQGEDPVISLQYMKTKGTPALVLDHTQMSIAGSAESGILGQDTEDLEENENNEAELKDTPVFELKTSSLTIKDVEKAAQTISIDARDSTISVRNTEQGILAGKFDLDTSTLAVSHTQQLALQIDSSSTWNNSTVSIEGNSDAINTLLSKDVVLKIKNCKDDISLDNVSFEEGAKIKADKHSQPKYFDLNTSTKYPVLAEEEVPEEEPSAQPEPEKTISHITVKFVSLNDGSEIAKTQEEDIENFVSVQDYVHNFSKGINGYNYVKYEYETDSKNNSITITLYYEAKEKYSVAVHYMTEGSTVPIHFANVLTGLTEGEAYDVSRFNAIEIPGYTYVSTKGLLKGDAGGKDHVLNVYCYYKADEGTEEKNDSSMQPEKGETVHTAAQTNSEMYVGLLAAAGAVAAAIAGLLFINSKKKHK